MSTWDKQDREVWKNSEVMQELEKKVASSIGKLSDFIKNAGLEEVSTQMGEIEKASPGAVNGVNGVADAIKRMDQAEDDELSNESTEEEIEEEVTEAAEDFMEVLMELSHKLADDGDTELAYKIERVMQDIESGFIQDED